MSYTSKVSHKYPTKARWKYTDEELKASAAQFKYRNDWKHGAPKQYQAAFLRGLLDQCCSHMTAQASPYAADYEIYAYEFEDRHVYVGLTFLPTARTSMHKVRGPVVEHSKICRNYTRRSIESGLTHEEAPAAEKRWITHYQSTGWTLLNKNAGGCTGTIRGRKWTKEAVLAEALKFKTKQAWIDGSQGSYRIAKHEGWFDEAVVHMPRRNTTHLVGRSVSKTTRQKQRAAKLGSKLTRAHRSKISESVRNAWAVRTTPLGNRVSEIKPLNRRCCMT